jgi:hypothetical protein
MNKVFCKMNWRGRNGSIFNGNSFSVLNFYKKIIVGMLLLTGFFPALLYGVTVDVTQSPYSADKTGAQDASAAIQAVLNSGADKIYFPSGTYKINTGLTVSANNMILYGDGQNKTLLTTSSDIAVLTGCSITGIKDMGFRQTNASKVGTAINFGNGAYFCELRNLTIQSFNKGIFVKSCLWTSFNNLFLKYNAIGIELTGNGSEWNVNWYNNQITFDNILCNGGEIGIKAACMGATFNNVTTQWQLDRGLGNVPTGKGTGIWLEGPADTTLGKVRNNVITNHYAEFTERPLYIKNSYNTVITGAFAQGSSSSSSPYPCWLEADNATVDVVGGINGLDYFAVSAILTNATLYGNCKAAFDVSGSNYVTLNSGGVYKRSGRAQVENSNFYINHTGGGNIEIDYTLKRFHHYRIYIGGRYDGYSLRYAAYKLFRYSSDSLTKVSADGDNSSDITLSVVDSKPVINLGYSYNYKLYVTVEDVSDMTGKHTETEGLLF